MWQYKNMKFWKDTFQEKQYQENSSKSDRISDTIIDVYKKEILDTRIIVSNLIRNSRVRDITNPKTTNKDSIVTS